MGDAIFSITSKMKEYDAILIYYAGHGFQVGEDNILAPIELNIQESAEMVSFNAFKLSDLMKQLYNYPNKTKIVIIDACRETLDSRGMVKDFAPFLAPQGSIIAFSTSPGQPSKENISSGHGYYTDALLKYISTPRVPIETIFKQVRESLCSQQTNMQIPWEHTSLIGDFYFNPDTIYDGINYYKNALCDKEFVFNNDSDIKEIVEDLKSHNWFQQESAIKKLIILILKILVVMNCLCLGVISTKLQMEIVMHAKDLLMIFLKMIIFLLKQNFIY